MKKTVFLFIASLLMIGMVWGQGSEDFENHSLSGTSYVDGSFVGNNSITWNYIQVTGEQSYPITDKGILLRRSGANSKIYSSTVSGGIGSFSVQMRKAFTGTGDRQVALYINSTHVADSQTFGSESGADATIHTFSVSDINIAGDIVIEVRHISGGDSNRQLVLDNLTWTAYSGSSSITTGAVSTPPFYVDSASSASGTVAYTSTGTFSGATFTAYLSDASGSFASPTSIGTASITGTDPSGNINISIPAGTAEGSGYKIRIDCASPSITGSESSAFTIQNGAKDVTGVSISSGNGSLSVSWTNPTTIYDEVMIVAKASASITGTPTGNGSSYTGNLNFGSGTAFDSGYVVYKGSTSPQTITNLSNGTTYYVKIFTRKNSNWSSGVEDSDTPIVPPPGAPTATDATSVDDDSFTANWSTVSGATGYYLDVYTKTTGSNATDLFISEYVEGSGTGNKYIEIYNGTGASVNLSNYTLRLYSNGSPTVSQSVVLVGTLLNGDTYVIGRTDGVIYTSSDLTSNTVINFNGDDAIELYRTDTLATVDIFGRIGDDPGTAWTGDGGYTTLDRTLVRKSSVSQGITVNPTGTGPTAFTTLTTEWDMYNQDTASYLGSHTFSSGESIEYVSGFEDLDVENVTSYSVTGLSPGTTYYYVVRAYNTSGTSANSNEIEVETTSPSATITTGAVSTPPFYVDSATSASGTVAYTSTGTFSGATFTAKLSDASGSFASPTNIGTSGSITGSNPSGSINITIPTGTTEGSGYKIRIDCGSPSITGSESSVFSIQNGAKNVTGVSSTVDSGSLTVSWTNPTTIYDEIMIVAKASASISGTPSGDGSSYTANLAYGSGTAFDSGYVVYKGATSPQTITNLTNQTTYYVKVFTRKNSNWSSGVEINNTPAVQPALVDIIVPQYMQGLNGTNNQRIPTAFRFRLDNLTPSATYRYYGRFIQSTDIATYTGAGIGWFVNSDNTFTRSDVLSYTTTGQYSEFTTDATGSYTGWFMGEPSGNVRFTPGNDLWFRIMLNDGADGTAVETILTSASAIKVINFGTQENVNQGTFLRGVSQSPAKNFIFVYDNEAGTGRPISGTVVESDGLDLSGVTQILPLYKNNVDAIAGAWGLIIPNSVGSKGFTGIKRIESRNLSDANIYGEATDSDGVWPSGTDTTDPTGGDDVSEHLVMGSGDATLPVELSSFTVALNAYNAAVLTWVTQTETGVNGFYILRGATDQLIDAAMVSDLIPATNTSQTQVYTYRDSELFGTGTYYYWLNVNDMDGSESFHGPITLVYQTGDNPTPTIPKLTELKSIYPNPFNPSANISYGLATPAEVEFRIYNSRGQMVRNMALGMKDAGTWNLVWNGTDNSGQTVPTGVYYIRMQAGKDSFMRKAVMMK